EIIHNKDYKRMVISGFLHVDINHLVFNMLTLFFFGPIVDATLGTYQFIVLFMASLLGGNMLSLYMQRANYAYSAVGASGAISGVVFAAIALIPNLKLNLIILPFFDIPGWLFGLAYVLYSIYGMRAQRDNIGHEAHLGGGITGVLVALIYMPQIVISNYLPIALILIPSAIFFYLVIIGKIK